MTAFPFVWASVAVVTIVAAPAVSTAISAYPRRSRPNPERSRLQVQNLLATKLTRAPDANAARLDIHGPMWSIRYDAANTIATLSHRGGKSRWRASFPADSKAVTRLSVTDLG